MEHFRDPLQNAKWLLEVFFIPLRASPVTHAKKSSREDRDTLLCTSITDLFGTASTAPTTFSSI